MTKDVTTESEEVVVEEERKYFFKIDKSRPSVFARINHIYIYINQHD